MYHKLVGIHIIFCRYVPSGVTLLEGARGQGMAGYPID